MPTLPTLWDLRKTADVSPYLSGRSPQKHWADVYATSGQHCTLETSVDKEQEL